VPVLYVIFVEDLHLVRWEQELSDHNTKGESVTTSGEAASKAQNDRGPIPDAVLR